MEVDTQSFNFPAMRARIVQPWDREPAYSELDENPNSGKPNGQPNFNFGLAQRLSWKPRVDGFILLKEMTLNP